VCSGNIGNVGLLGSSEVDGGVVTEPWQSPDDIADHRGATKDTVSSWVAEKLMHARKIGRRRKFQANEMYAWVRSHGAADSDRHEAGD